MAADLLVYALQCAAFVGVLTTVACLFTWGCSAQREEK